MKKSSAGIIKLHANKLFYSGGSEEKSFFMLQKNPKNKLRTGIKDMLMFCLFMDKGVFMHVLGIDSIVPSLLEKSTRFSRTVLKFSRNSLNSYLNLNICILHCVVLLRSGDVFKGYLRNNKTKLQNNNFSKCAI